MTLFSRIDKDNPHKEFKIKLLFPKFEVSKKYNEWSDELYKVVKLTYNTNFIWNRTHGWWYIELSLLGFGVAISRQTDY
jgi:hypothetical protein